MLGSTEGPREQLAKGAGGVGVPQVFTPSASPPPHGKEGNSGEEERRGRGEQNTGAESALDTVSSASEEEESKLCRDAHFGEEEEGGKHFVSRANLIFTNNSQGLENDKGNTVQHLSHTFEEFVAEGESDNSEVLRAPQFQGFEIAHEQGTKFHAASGGVSVENPACDSSCPALAEIPDLGSGDAAMDWSIDPPCVNDHARHERGRESPQHPHHPEARRGRVTVVVATAQKVPDKNCSEPCVLCHNNSSDNGGGFTTSAFSPPKSACQSSFSPYSSHLRSADGVDNSDLGVNSFDSCGLDDFTNGNGVALTVGPNEPLGQQETRSSDYRDHFSSDIDAAGVKRSECGSIDTEYYRSVSGDNLNSSQCYTDSGSAEVRNAATEGPRKQIVDVSSQHERHTERTTTTVEKTVTTERRDGASSGLVDVVTDTCITKTVIRENDDSVTTTTTTSSLYPDSGIGDSSFVSTFNTTTENLSFDSTLNDSGAQVVPGAFPQTDTPAGVTGHTQSSTLHRDPVGSASSRFADPPCVTTTEPPGQEYTFTSTPRLPTARPHPNTTYGQNPTVCAGDLNSTGHPPDAGMISDIKGQGLHSSSTQPERSMHADTDSARLLDSLHAQLTQISSELSKLDTEDSDQGNRPLSSSDNNTAFRDHAEATSVLKQIVRGEFKDLNTNASPVNRLAKFPTSLPCDLNLDLQNTNGDTSEELKREKEYYDNEADCATTDLPKNGSSRHHHIQLLKPGHQKASSLWTLQEETESLVDACSPRSSPRRTTCQEYREPGVSELITGHTTIRPYRRLSESSDGEESDGRYSSVSTGNSWTDRSLSSRERTPLSDTDQSMDWAEANNPSVHVRSFNDFVSGLQSPQASPGVSHENNNGGRGLPMSSSFKPGSEDFSTSDIQTPSSRSSLRPSSFPASRGQDSASSSRSFKAGDQDFITSGMEALESLTASLEQFSATSGFFSASESLDNSSSTLEGDRRIGEEFVTEGSCRLHALDLDLSRISSCSSPVPSDFSEASNFTCTGTAEVRTFDSFDYDTVLDVPQVSVNIPSSINSRHAEKPLKSALKRPIPPEIRDLTENQKETYRRFDELLNDFHSKTSPEAIHEVRFLDDLRNEPENPRSTRKHRHTASKDLNTPSGANYEQLYKDFTNNDSEKKQNNTCVVVEDENMGGFRFKRFLKKSHTRRNKKGRKVMRFLSRLNCVSETVHSPDMNAHRKQLTSEGQAVTFSTDSMPSPKARKISHPPVFVTLSSDTFQQSNVHRVPKEDVHQTVLVEHHPHPHSPALSSPDKSPSKSTPSSSNQSLDSLRSRTDSAYSSISESTPAGQQLNFTWTPQALSPTHGDSALTTTFHSSGDRTLSTDSGFSATPNSAYSTTRTFSVFHDPTSPSPDSRSLMTKDIASTATKAHYSDLSTPSVEVKAQHSDMLSALSEVFDELDVCEGEIDTALINRLRHGHVQAGTGRKF